MTRPIRPPRTRTPCSEQTHTEPVATNPRLLHATSAARAESLGSLRFPGGSGGMRRRQRLPRGCARGDRGNTHPRTLTSRDPPASWLEARTVWAGWRWALASALPPYALPAPTRVPAGEPRFPAVAGGAARRAQSGHVRSRPHQPRVSEVSLQTDTNPAEHRVLRNFQLVALHAPGRNRTCDLALRRRALYPLSYGRAGRPKCRRAGGELRLAVGPNGHLFMPWRRSAAGS